VTARVFVHSTPRRARYTRRLIYPINSGQIKKRVVARNLPQMLPNFGSRWLSIVEADCNRFRGTAIRQQQRVRWRSRLQRQLWVSGYTCNHKTVAASLNRQGLIAKAARTFKVYG
jgi:hypothetical protein